MRHPLPPLARTWPVGYPAHEAVGSEEARALDRAAEADFGLPSFVLMEHASVAVAHVARLLAGARGRVTVLCGPGNNGGDGYGAGRFLASWGLEVRVLCLSRRPPVDGDAGRELALLRQVCQVEDGWNEPGRVADALSTTDVAVDALFGVGLARDLEPPYTRWIDELNAADVTRLAVDVPSGLDADRGLPRPAAVVADVTVTMALPKAGLLTPSGARHAGHVIEADIGLPGPLHRRYVAK